MKVEKYTKKSITNDIYAVVSNLLNDAFEERRQQNIDFRCGRFSPADVESDLTDSDYLFIAFNESEVPVGTACLKIRKKMNYTYGTFESLGVASSCKRQGIGTLLANERIRIAEELGLDFLASTTACNATSSVRYHIKMGFLIYMKSFGKGYNSYSFILPLKKANFLKCSFIRACIFVLATTLGVIKKYI